MVQAESGVDGLFLYAGRQRHLASRPLSFPPFSRALSIRIGSAFHKASVGTRSRADDPILLLVPAGIQGPRAPRPSIAKYYTSAGAPKVQAPVAAAQNPQQFRLQRERERGG